MRKLSAAVFAVLAASCVTIALAQQPASPPPEELEPAVDTSAQTTEPGTDTETAPPTPAPAAPTRSEPAQPAQPQSAPAATPPRNPRALDRLELDTTQITGNRELPKVLYIVPWKRSDLGDLVGKPVNSLLDEVLTPVDRDVFRRENRYYRALQAEGSPDPVPPPATQPGPER